MATNKKDKQQTKTQSLVNLPIVTLSEKDMSSVNGGRIGLPGGS